MLRSLQIDNFDQSIAYYQIALLCWESNVWRPFGDPHAEWLPNRLANYYMYFAHHGGTYIRLAYSDSLEGPWQLHDGGSLRLEQAAAFTIISHHQMFMWTKQIVEYVCTFTVRTLDLGGSGPALPILTMVSISKQAPRS